jgi:hypothetical protein
LIFSSRYSFKATALLNFSSFEPYSKVIDPSFTLSRICFTESTFLSNSLKYRRLNSFISGHHVRTTFLTNYFAISFCHKLTFTSSLLKPRGQNLSTNILKLLFPLGLSYILSIFIIGGHLPLKLFRLTPFLKKESHSGI